MKVTEIAKTAGQKIANVGGQIFSEEFDQSVQGSKNWEIPGIDTTGSFSRGAANRGMGEDNKNLGIPGMGVPTMGMQGSVDPLGMMGGVSSNAPSDRETMSLARLVGIAQGPAAIMVRKSIISYNRILLQCVL